MSGTPRMAALTPAASAPSGEPTQLALTSLVAACSSAPAALAQLCGTDSPPILVDEDRLPAADDKPAPGKVQPPAPRAANCGVGIKAPPAPAVVPSKPGGLNVCCPIDHPKFAIP